MITADMTIKNVFNPNEYIEYEIEEQGKMYYSDKERKTYFLNEFAVYILSICDNKTVEQIFATIKQNVDTGDTSDDTIFSDICQYLEQLSAQNFIKLE